MSFFHFIEKSFHWEEGSIKEFENWDPASSFTWNSLLQLLVAPTVIIKFSILRTIGTKKVLFRALEHPSCFCYCS